MASSSAPAKMMMLNGGGMQGKLMQQKQHMEVQAPSIDEQQAEWVKPQMPKPLREMPLQTYDSIEAEYAEDIDKICGDHENLIKVILEEEEELIGEHRQHIDDVVDIIKSDMGIL